MNWLRQVCIGDRDLEDSTNQWTTVLSSFLFFLCLYLICLVLSLLSETYRRLSNREKVFWHLSIVRAVFGVFGAYSGISTFLWTPELHADIINGKTPESYFIVMVTTGFFLFECATLFASNIYFRFIDWNLALHHLLSLMEILMTVHYGKAHFFGCQGLLLEVTTPFSAVCWLLLKAKKADTMLWRANQYILIHLFHCRTTVELYIWWATYQNLPIVLSDMPVPLGALLSIELTLINFYLTPFWTYKKTKQLFNPVDWNHPDAKKTQ